MSKKTFMQQKSTTALTVKDFFTVVNNGLGKLTPRLESVLPAGYSVERFKTVAYYYIRNREYLWSCNPETLFNAFLEAAQQGLDLAIPNEAHIVPFKGNASLIRGYKGDMKLARKNPNICYVDARPVYSGDTYERTQGDAPSVNHRLPEFGKDRGKLLGFYAIAKDKSGNVYYEEMTNEEILAHAKRYTKATSSGPFADIQSKGIAAVNWESYGLKTVLIRLCLRKLDLSSDMGGNNMTDDEERAVSVLDNNEATRPPSTLSIHASTDFKLPKEVPPQETEEQRLEKLQNRVKEKRQQKDVAGEVQKKEEAIEVARDKAENFDEGWRPTPEEEAEILRQEKLQAATQRELI
jgi:phage RecT family recombinase